jgi:hypothetical protein
MLVLLIANRSRTCDMALPRLRRPCCLDFSRCPMGGRVFGHEVKLYLTAAPLGKTGPRRSARLGGVSLDCTLK